MSASGSDWIVKETERLVREYGAVPPPWHVFPDIHPYSIGWRMGSGESHLMVFNQWWEGQNFSEEERIAYFRHFPPPPCWLDWMIAAIWEEDLPDEEADLTPYFARAESLGFGSKADFDKDMEDPKWLEE